MHPKEPTEAWQEHLARAGFKGSIVPVQHVADLRSGLIDRLEGGFLNRKFYDEIVSRYDLQWDFEHPDDFPSARSILIVAVPQPKVKITFKLPGETYSVILPPTYIHDSERKSTDILSLYAKQYGYTVGEAILPEKLLAVHSGLARYGRNNVAYINGWGSYFRAKAFFSDMPCSSDNWGELQMMELCRTCSACVKTCPTGAIKKDRFLIHGERCLTYFNEGSEDFPEWIDPEWHHCLIGCLICQDICPENKELRNWTSEGEAFSEEETAMIVKGVSKDTLSREMIEKLQKLYLLDNYNLLQRNLGALITKMRNKNMESDTGG